MPGYTLVGTFRAGEAVLTAYGPPWESNLPTFELGGVYFGGWPNTLQVSDFTPGAPDIRSQDAERPNGDGIFVGRDYLGASSWAFDIFTDVDSGLAAFDALDTLAAAWYGNRERTTPGAVMPLRYYVAGRWRRVYGRPRRYAPPAPGVVAMQGRAEVSADFLVVDHRFYADEENSQSVGTIPASNSGFTFPLTFPMSTAQRTLSERGGAVTVNGSAPTHPVITIKGPITDPLVDMGIWRLPLRGRVPTQTTVTIDARPWVQTIMRNDGASVSGMLDPRTQLRDLALPPGHHQLRLGGIDLTGTARATIAWRPAYYSL